MILPDTSAPTTPEMENKLIASIHDAWPITTHLHAIEFIRTLTKEWFERQKYFRI